MKCRKHQVILNRVFFVGFWAAFAFISSGLGVLAHAAKITAIDFYGMQDPNLIEIRSDEPVNFEKQDNAKDRQVVIEVKGATLQPSLKRKIDTSSFDSQVILISPYQVEGQADVVRVVIQLRGQTQVTVVQEGNLIKASVPVKGGADSADLEDSSTKNDPKKSGSRDDLGAVQSAEGVKEEDEDLSPGAQRLKGFMANREAKKFKGKPITLQVRDVEAADVFRLIGDASGFNMILTDDVKGKLTLSLIDVPWDEALEVVLKMLGLTAERNKNILRIVSVKNYTQEKLDEYRANQAAVAAEPRVTRIFPISYASIEDLTQVIGKMQASLGGSIDAGAAAVGAASPAPSSVGGSIIADKRTNSVIIRDTVKNMERIKKLIEILDTQTPQVLIEGKAVEVQENYAKQISGSLGLGNNTSFGGFSGGNPIDPLVGGVSSPFANGGAIAKQSGSFSSGGTLGLGFLPGASRLNAILNLGESENKVKVVASPRVVVLNKEKATIVQGTPVVLQTVGYVNGVAVPTFATQSANLSLDTTPTVTNDGNIRLDLTLTRDLVADLGSAGNGVANRNIKTNVVVESGTTLVLGGVYIMSDDQSESGFPFLRKIPILGALFATQRASSLRNELIFFITPQILNPKKAGFSGSSS